MTERDQRRARVRTERLAQLGTLLAGFAHEVRNPLSTIGLNLELVLEEFAGADSARDRRLQKRLATVQAEVKRLQKILDEFLSFARAPAPQPKPEDLNQRLRAVVEFTAPAMQERGIALKFYPSSEVGRVPLDWDHLHAALVNLLRNAEDAIEGPGEVLLATSREGDEVVIRVTDTGKGIPADVQGRVFEPYFSTKKAGTGLGLPTTRRIVEEHGGSLTFRSEPGKGTQFELRLPAMGDDERRGAG